MKRPCCMCDEPAHFKFKTLIPATGAHRVQWFCAAHWRIRAGGIRAAECSVCKRLKHACLAHST